MHWPLAHWRPFVVELGREQDCPSGATMLAGQVPDVPVQVSAGSQIPVLERQIVPEVENWQDEQQSSLASSHTAPEENLHVVGLQHGSSEQPEGPPQSQSSPSSTMPLPHWAPEMVGMFLLVDRQEVSTEFLPMALQMFPTEQGENAVMPLVV